MDIGPRIVGTWSYSVASIPITMLFSDGMDKDKVFTSQAEIWRDGHEAMKHWAWKAC